MMIYMMAVQWDLCGIIGVSTYRCALAANLSDNQFEYVWDTLGGF